MPAVRSTWSWYSLLKYRTRESKMAGESENLPSTCRHAKSQTSCFRTPDESKKPETFQQDAAEVSERHRSSRVKQV